MSIRPMEMAKKAKNNVLCRVVMYNKKVGNTQTNKQKVYTALVRKWLVFSASLHLRSCVETQLHLAPCSMYRNGGMALPNLVV